MDPIGKFVRSLSANARKKRAALFRKYFTIYKETKILDLGSENGTNIFNVLKGTDHDPKNVFIADIEPRAVEEGRKLYGFTPVIIDEQKPLDFPDSFFNIVYCSSVIEHTTVPKDELWNWKDGNKFRQASLLRQQEVAREIMRLGKEYFVQTPSKDISDRKPHMASLCRLSTSSNVPTGVEIQ
jgi:SAM-dependent methyltransferase